MNLFTEYINTAPAIIALINGFIALVVAQYFRDHLVAKILLDAVMGPPRVTGYRG